MTVKHKHLLIRAEVHHPPGAADTEATCQWVQQLIETIDMRLLGGPWATYCDQPGNRGISVVAIIETSHVSLHVWDEQRPGLLQLDVYSCADFDPQQIFAAIDERFGALAMSYKFLDRENGLQEIPVTAGGR